MCTGNEAGGGWRGPWARALVSQKLPRVKRGGESKEELVGTAPHPPPPSPVQASESWMPVSWNSGVFLERKRRGERRRERKEGWIEGESGEEGEREEGRQQLCLSSRAQRQGTRGADDPRGQTCRETLSAVCLSVYFVSLHCCYLGKRASK